MNSSATARANGQMGLAAVQEFMRDARWEAEVIREVADYCAYRVSFKDDFPVVGSIMEVNIDQQQFVCYLLLRPIVPETRRTMVVEFITRANFGMKIGNFEMNVDEGEGRYEASVDFQRTELSKVLVNNAVMAALDSVEPYSAAFLSVVQGGMDAAQAIREVESG